jgi:hypothetical protein
VSKHDTHHLLVFTGLVVVIGVGAGLIAPLIAPAVINSPINSREDCERVYERPCRIRWEPTP